MPNYQVISDGARTINNGWQTYEVKFQDAGEISGGENVTLWGRRFFLPTAIRGMKNGYILTLLTTSLSKDVKSVDGVGGKGGLATVLETFEPNQY